MAIFANDKMYKVDDVAKTLKVNRATVYRMMRDTDNTLEAVKIKGCIRLSGESLNAYVDANKFNPLED